MISAVPSLQPDAQKEAPYAALALLIAGHVAVGKYSILPSRYVHQISVPASRSFVSFDSVLTDLAKSVTLYLHDEASSHRVIAIELCSFGFQIWQHYVDAMEILRSLFTLATGARKDNDAASRTVASTARAAVLQIASSNTPLFMTTMSLDILQPKTPEYRNSIMQLIAFMIRKVTGLIMGLDYHCSTSGNIAETPSTVPQPTPPCGGGRQIPGP